MDALAKHLDEYFRCRLCSATEDGVWFFSQARQFKSLDGERRRLSATAEGHCEELSLPTPVEGDLVPIRGVRLLETTSSPNMPKPRRLGGAQLGKP